MNGPTPEGALAEIVKTLSQVAVPFTLVSGLAVSIRAEVRFTRDVDLAIGVDGDAAVERLVRELRGFGYRVLALVEHEERNRLATVRLLSDFGVVVDLIVASCGIENEIVAAATAESVWTTGTVPVARAEDLLAMKVLSMTDRRLQRSHRCKKSHLDSKVRTRRRASETAFDHGARISSRSRFGRKTRVVTRRRVVGATEGGRPIGGWAESSRTTAPPAPASHPQIHAPNIPLTRLRRVRAQATTPVRMPRAARSGSCPACACPKAHRQQS